ncbi:hypothetical protein BV372_25115 [Nostoc sp. T09]|uniref:hypothetical protein n=1 Tax=Nostoc sp. T09 TaxID=1932621 RepID=UPI000A379ACE|nr:hypothetical protein [Nostoc sp. T09]OUL28446.1 hypothetical protein BV372_25115 [Nostoc sp. T09]
MTIAVDRPQKFKSAQICDRLGYHVIDPDVHTQEFSPAFLDDLELVGGSEIGDRFLEDLASASCGQWFNGLDSEYDYDPVSAKCVELKLFPTTLSSGMDWTAHCSISNYQYNYIGHFASAGEASCKSLSFGGVTRRFLSLKEFLTHGK